MSHTHTLSITSASSYLPILHHGLHYSSHASLLNMSGMFHDLRLYASFSGIFFFFRVHIFCSPLYSLFRDFPVRFIYHDQLSKAAKNTQLCSSSQALYLLTFCVTWHLLIYYIIYLVIKFILQKVMKHSPCSMMKR